MKRRTRKDTTTTKLTNKKMSKSVYRLRRQVIDVIYEIKALVPDTPRVDVRVTEDDDTILAVGRMGGCVIWISERSIVERGFDLRTVVYHEMMHAVYSIEHDKFCPLMKPTHTPLTREACQRYYLQHIKNNSKKA